MAAAFFAPAQGSSFSGWTPYKDAGPARVAALGEPLLSYFDPEALAAELRAQGFSELEDFDLRAIATHWLDAPKGAESRARGPHFLRARRVG